MRSVARVLIPAFHCLFAPRSFTFHHYFLVVMRYLMLRCYLLTRLWLVQVPEGFIVRHTTLESLSCCIDLSCAGFWFDTTDFLHAIYFCIYDLVTAIGYYFWQFLYFLVKLAWSFQVSLLSSDNWWTCVSLVFSPTSFYLSHYLPLSDAVRSRNRDACFTAFRCHEK